ncbi:hypothetical protein F7725_006842 [Dissostichus mawsoni]|uniref:Uncharacterized protein n=1 Tax=Dissostichus mawsoni TaxID=36200 RepID=A0A7J5XV13_DISMA|nr:hypothetical protein F7725_006842 [Dissostichus mawsoni]
MMFAPTKAVTFHMGNPQIRMRGSQLPPLSVVHNGVIEVSDDSVGRPGHRDDAQDTTHDEEHTCSNGYFALGLLIFNAVVHPQALPIGLRRDNVASNESRHLPHGQGTDDDRGSQLPPLSVVHNGVVEVSDDSVGRPGHRDDAQDTTHDENTPAAMATLLLASSSSMQLVHFPPATASMIPIKATKMEITTRARAA